MAGDLTALQAALPDYRIDGRLGEGRFGVVYAAHHVPLGRDVAVKLLVASVAADPEQHERFRREARVLASLDHRHVVRVHDFRDTADGGALVMERLTGGTLADRLPAMDPPSIVVAIVAAASALHHVHRKGLLHRDVTPQNLMFDDAGVLKVTDFGTAASVWAAVGTQEPTTDLSAGRDLIGTPGFLAPEQAVGPLGLPPENVGPAADQYALAAVLYRALSGRWTHDPRGGSALLLRRRVALPADPLAGPPAIARVVAVALSRDAGDRYPSVQDFAHALIDAGSTTWGPGWARSSQVAVLEPGVLTDDVRAAGAADHAAGSAAGRRWSRRGSLTLGGAAGLALASGSIWWINRSGADRSATYRAASGTTSSGTTSSGATVTTADLPPVSAIPSTPPTPGFSPRGTLTLGWTYATAAKVTATALLVDDLVVVGSTDTLIHAIGRDSGKRDWAAATGGQVWATAVAVDVVTADGGVLPLIVVGSYDGQVYACRRDTGTIEWQQPIEMRISAGAVVIGTSVVVAADQLHTFEVSTGVPGPTHPIDGGVIWTPLVDGAVVFAVSVRGVVHAVDIDAARELWAVAVDGPPRTAPVLLDGLVVVGTTAGTVHALTAAGQLSWTYRARAVVTGLAVVDDGLVVSTADGFVVLLAADPIDGWAHDPAVRWTSDQLAGRPGAAARAGERIVVGSDDGRLFLLDLSSGSLRDWIVLDGSVIATPVVDGDRMFIASLRGVVYEVLSVG